MSWTAKQSCPHCEWEGLTRHQICALAVFLSYVVAVIVVVAFDIDLFPNGGTAGAWVVVIAANMWFYLFPGWLLRRNACPSCARRFPIGATKAEKKPGATADEPPRASP
ncbi:MAG TPA: hypothetical protein VM869_19620 [Enhygromyxa sp.]|nr:hypothetical protein [Enhygromyxa sp.]